MSNKPKCRNDGKKAWSFRRRIVITALLFCAGIVAKITLWGHQSEGIGEALVTSAFGLAGAVIGSYIFGAVWNDKSEIEREVSKPGGDEDV